MQPLDTHVPSELVGALLAVAILSSYMLVRESQYRYQEMIQACVHIGEETRQFVQELQASFGCMEETLPLRFVASKYALAAVYIFFFTIKAGTITARGWNELRAKGLLDDREVLFLEGEYSGDRMALLHVWAMWAVQEAASVPGACARGCPEVASQSIARLSATLQRVTSAAHNVTDHVAMPSPYQLCQLHESLILICMLVISVATASVSARTHYVASVAFLSILVAVLGIRQAAASLSNPLGQDSINGFPVASMINATSDAVAQLLLGSTPSVFDPSLTWWDTARAVPSQGHIERRTPATALPKGGANPCLWPTSKTDFAVMNDEAPPPLTDIGCCHVDTEALPWADKKPRGSTYRVARQPRKDRTEALLSRLQLAMDSKCKPPESKGNGGSGTSTSTADPSDTGSNPGCKLDLSRPYAFRAGGKAVSSVEHRRASSCNSPYAYKCSEVDDDWASVAERMSKLPREQSLASKPVCISYPGAVGAVKTYAVTGCPCNELVIAGTWADPAEPSRVRGGASVSPDDLVLTTTPNRAPCVTSIEATSALQVPHSWHT